MAKKVSFNVRLEADPTKAQEADLLMKMADAFRGTGTYIEMLFSPKLIEFARLQILNDFSPEVDEYLEMDDVVSEIEAKAKKQIDDARNEFVKVKATADELSILLDKCRERYSNYHDEALKERQGWQSACDDYLGQIADLKEGLENAKITVQELRQEVLQLKASYFDALVKMEAGDA